MAAGIHTINVHGDIGTAATGLTTNGVAGTPLLSDFSNAAIFVQGNLQNNGESGQGVSEPTITSEAGGIGNIVVMGQDTVSLESGSSFTDIGIQEAGILAQNNIGDIWAGLGGWGANWSSDSYIESRTGSIGVISVRDSFDLSDTLYTDISSNSIDAAVNIGGIVSRNGGIGSLDYSSPLIINTPTGTFAELCRRRW